MTLSTLDFPLIPEIPEPIMPPTSDDFTGIFDRIEILIDRVEGVCMIVLIIVIVLGALYLLSKIFGGHKR